MFWAFKLSFDLDILVFWTIFQKLGNILFNFLVTLAPQYKYGFHKHFTPVTYDPREIKLSILILHAMAGCVTCGVSQNTPAYFAKAVSYAGEMFMELTALVGSFTHQHY